MKACSSISVSTQEGAGEHVTQADQEDTRGLWVKLRGPPPPTDVPLCELLLVMVG